MSIVGKIKLADVGRSVRPASACTFCASLSRSHHRIASPLSLGQRHGKDRLRLQIRIDHFPFRLTILRFVSTILHRIILHLDHLFPESACLLSTSSRFWASGHSRPLTTKPSSLARRSRSSAARTAAAKPPSSSVSSTPRQATFRPIPKAGPSSTTLR